MKFDDSNKIGLIGESLFERYISSIGRKYKDVRDIKNFQYLDIDFVLFNSDVYTEDDSCLDVFYESEIRSGNPSVYIKRRNEIGMGIEVKVDCVTHNRKRRKDGTFSEGTGNMVYEIISHNMPGCLARTYADYILYVCVDDFDETGVYKFVKVYLVETVKLREWMTKKENECYLKPKSIEMIDGQLENINNYLIPVDKLKNDKIFKDVTEIYEPFF
jgi:hypothetical protein